MLRHVRQVYSHPANPMIPIDQGEGGYPRRKSGIPVLKLTQAEPSAEYLRQKSTGAVSVS
jgi:hypothetical protein